MIRAAAAVACSTSPFDSGRSSKVAFTKGTDNILAEESLRQWSSWD
jgi:hypothetical protein